MCDASRPSSRSGPPQVSSSAPPSLAPTPTPPLVIESMGDNFVCTSDIDCAITWSGGGGSCGRVALEASADGEVVRVLTELRAKQQTEGPTWGIDGTTGKVADMNAKDGPRIWEPYAVKVQTVKTAIEAASLILRVDDIVSGIKGQK